MAACYSTYSKSAKPYILPVFAKRERLTKTETLILINLSLSFAHYCPSLNFDCQHRPPNWSVYNRSLIRIRSARNQLSGAWNEWSLPVSLASRRATELILNFLVISVCFVSVRKLYAIDSVETFNLRLSS